MYIQLAEDKPMRLETDEVLNLNPFFSYMDTPDWGFDPVEILMAKQERERLELEYELAGSLH